MAKHLKSVDDGSDSVTLDPISDCKMDGNNWVVDGKEIRTGPPPSYEKIRKIIKKKVNRLK